MSQSADVSSYRARHNSAFVRRIRAQRERQRLDEEKRRRAEARAEHRRAAEEAADKRVLALLRSGEYREKDKQQRREAIEQARAMAFTPFARIQALACRVFDVWPADLVCEAKTKELVLARQFVCYWARRRTKLSYPNIGRLLGGRDHTTVLAGARAYPIKRAVMGRTLRTLA